MREAQTIHAARKSALLAPPDSDPDTEFAGALWVRDEGALRALAAVLARDGVPHAVVVEDSAPHAGQLMAVGIAPVRKSYVRRYLSSIPRIK